MAAAATQLAFAYRSSKRGDPLLLQAAALAGSLNMQLSVVVPFVLPADGPGCCGIRGRRWEEMLRQVAEEDAERARRVIDDAGVPHSVAVAEGSSVPDIVEGFVSKGDRDLALPETPSGTAFTRSDLRRMKRVAPGTVRGLSAPPTCRDEPADARLLLSYREDLLRHAPSPEITRELEELNRPVEDAIKELARGLSGRLSRPAIERTVLVVFDLPYGAARRHLIAGSNLPADLRSDVETAVRAMLARRGKARP